MQLSPPKTAVWWIALILGVLGLLIELGTLSIPDLNPYGVWLIVLALVLMLVSTRVHDL